MPLPGDVFINYRREDAAGEAGRIHDRLNARLPGRIFMDVAGIEPGIDFIEAIEKAVGSCAVCLAVIGPRWLATRRLDDPDDFVRLELTTALKRDVRVIPVLVGGASMPRREDLPEDLAPLVRRNAIRIEHTDFDNDVRRLGDTVERILGRKLSGASSGRRKAVLAVAALFLALAAGWWIWSRRTGQPVITRGTPESALQQAADAAEKFVALIREEDRSTATGSLVQPGTVLLTTDYVGKMTGVMRAQLGARLVTLRLLTIDAETGLAAFRPMVRGAERDRGLRVTGDTPAQGELVAAVGSALGGPLTTVIGQVLGFDQKFLRIRFRRDSMAGFGGCPVLNAAGEVVAVLHSGTAPKSQGAPGEHYCVRGDLILSFLERVAAAPPQ